MKRNLDLIREILLKVEEFEPTQIYKLQTISPREFSGSEPENWHHINLLLDSGLLKSGTMTGAGDVAIHGMTMAGHDFLGAVREKSIWEHTKKRLGAAGGWTFELVLSVATEEIKRRLLGSA